MGLSSVVRKAVAVANKVTKDLQVDILHYPCIGLNDGATPILATTPIPRKAILDEALTLALTQPNNMTVSLKGTTLLFIGPIAEYGVWAGRDEPIDLRDKLVLPSGRTLPIANARGIVDPSTKHPYLYEVTLGE